VRSVSARRAVAAAGLAVVTMGSGCGRPAAPPPPAAASQAISDGGDAQRLVALVDYVGSDYAVAVQGGVVVSAFEYEEQLRFIHDARAMAAALLGPGAGAEPVTRALDQLSALVNAKASAADVAAASRAAKDEVVARFGLRTTPTERPSLARAEALFAESCATCHGARGDADTERARQLQPQPVSFKDPARRAVLSPYRVFNTLTFGIPGTAMASFDTLVAGDRWSLAFYVFRLGHGSERPAGVAEDTIGMPLADMAFRSDAEMLEVLRREGHRSPERALAYVRTEAAFQEPPAGVGIDRTQMMLRQALAAFEAGRARDADRLALDAYLLGFEPLEPRLRGRDAQATADVERAFHALRAVLQGSDRAAVRAAHRQLDQQLTALRGSRATALPFVAAFFIYLREGVEAALLVGALLAGLGKLGRPDARRYIHLGWIAALVAGIATWWIAEQVLAVTARQREVLEAAIALVAAVVLFSISFWMISKVESQRWMAYLRKRLEQTLTRRNVAALAFVSFLATYREAAETVLFTQALMLDFRHATAQVWMGAAAGLLAVLVIAVVMNRTAVWLPLGWFFGVSSALLCILAISFAGSGLYTLVASGYLSPRPVRFPEVPWLGVYPDLTSLTVQLAILLVIAGAAVVSFRRRGEGDAA
jgi:high-affinity iron transporter